ncbi:MAG: adenine phosphoribosyltransferase [Sporomusaceae bacterium]|jgi:adenine phosphoribosyltransferase|nr:adenine phosphoribosyltransferase [Sporomusaceae bacterium]
MNFAEKFRDIPDFPRQGIIFKDITTFLKDGKAFQEAVNCLAKNYQGQKIDLIVSPESRGFILGSALAYALGAGFAPVRKAGKLPAATIKVKYALEYGEDTLEIHQDALTKGMRVLVVDDVLATGGTTKAAAELVETLGGEIAGFAFLLELAFLKGREKIAGYQIASLVVD